MSNEAKDFKYNVYFTVEERGQGFSKHFTLIDNEGYQCGIFATRRYAMEAIPRIRRNIVRELKRRDTLSKKFTVV